VIRSPLGLRINPDPSRSPRDQIREAARIGAKGVILDATGDLSPERLSETGRRDLRHTLRSVELALIALHLPTRRPFDSEDDLDSRLSRADRAFSLAYDLGSGLVLARVGSVPDETDLKRRAMFLHALTELGRRAEHRGVRLTIETGSESGATLKTALDSIANPGLAASLDPGALLLRGFDPIAATSDLADWIAHAYATDTSGSTGGSRNFGLGGSALNWEAYLGVLEQVGYRGFLTIWPDPAADQVKKFEEKKKILERY